jgi:hypothetical protein
VGTGTVSAPSMKVAWTASSGGLSVPPLAGVGAGCVPGGALFLLPWRASTFSIESAARLAPSPGPKICDSSRARAVKRSSPRIAYTASRMLVSSASGGRATPAPQADRTAQETSQAWLVLLPDLTHVAGQPVDQEDEGQQRDLR